MKPIFFKIALFVFLALGLSLSSCKKNDDKSPCDKPTKVYALAPANYELGHFVIDDGISYQFAPSQTYLKVVNWVDYKDKVTPGRFYKIGYKEVACDDKEEGRCGNGFCGTPNYVCVKIICFEALKTDDCFNSIPQNKDFDKLYSHATRFIDIQANTMRLKSYFSGCSPNDPIKFQLNYNITNEYVNDLRVVEVKILEMNTGISCQAVFEKEICFNLEDIKSTMQNNQYLNDYVNLRLYLGENVLDIPYYLK